MRTFGVELVNEGIKAVLLLQAVEAWRSCCFLLQGQVHALVAAILLRMARLDTFDRNPEPEPPDRELGEIEQGIGAGEGHAVIGADGKRQAALAEQALEGCDGRVFARRIESLTQEQEARGMIGDGQGITVMSIAELELSLEVGAPQIIGKRALRQRRAARAMARPAAALDQALTIEDRMDGAFGRNLDVAIEPAHHGRQIVSVSLIRFFGELIRFDQTQSGQKVDLPNWGLLLPLEVVMEKFVREQNLLRFRDLLLKVTDQEQRQTIHRLVFEEEAKGGPPRLEPPAE